jgi:hypothetical protein
MTRSFISHIVVSAIGIALLSGCTAMPYYAYEAAAAVAKSGGSLASNSIPSLSATLPTEILTPCNSNMSSCGTPNRQPAAGPTKFTAVGHGSAGNQGQYTTAQHKLMAMRAAQVDAYRMLAEQVQGFRVSGNTSVSAFAIQSDAVRSYVDSYIRGAQVVSIIAIADGNFQATVELEISGQFIDCVTKFNSCGTGHIPTGCATSGCNTSNSVRFSY